MIKEPLRYWRLKAMTKSNRCQVCQYSLFPEDMKNLKTIAGMELLIHSASYYILQIKCKFCGYDNYIYQKGDLTLKQLNDLIKKTLLLDEATTQDEAPQERGFYVIEQKTISLTNSSRSV